MHGYIDLKTLFVSAEGRLARMPFWIAMGLLIVLLVLYESIFGGQTLQLLTGWLAYPALIFLAVCVLAKRLHDRGKSGWYAAVIVAAFIGMWPYPNGLLDFVFFVILVWAVVELAVLPGEQGPNRFGPNPLKPAPV